MLFPMHILDCNPTHGSRIVNPWVSLVRAQGPGVCWRSFVVTLFFHHWFSIPHLLSALFLPAVFLAVPLHKRSSQRLAGNALTILLVLLRLEWRSGTAVQQFARSVQCLRKKRGACVVPRMRGEQTPLARCIEGHRPAILKPRRGDDSATLAAPLDDSHGFWQESADFISRDCGGG